MSREDVKNVNFVAFLDPQRFDISGSVNIPGGVSIGGLFEVELLSSKGRVLQTTSFSRSLNFFQFVNLVRGPYILRVKPWLGVQSKDLEVILSNHMSVVLAYPARSKNLSDEFHISSLFSLLFILLATITFFQRESLYKLYLLYREKSKEKLAEKQRDARKKN